jgi:hypothetical protein
MERKRGTSEAIVERPTFVVGNIKDVPFSDPLLKRRAERMPSGPREKAGR